MDRDTNQKKLARESGRDDKRDNKNKAAAERKLYKLEKIKLLTAKSVAVASKRKWLVILIATGIAAYFILSSNAGGILTKIKTFF
tara:strand:+ start:186 stop:440 length:255 start_codon:yes stop_codon:yes gene_type:complete